MNILERSLTRLTIQAYTDREMKKTAGTITAMYNPDSLQLNYQTEYTPDTFINSDTQSNSYRTAYPGKLDLELVFDARMPGNTTPIEQQLTRLHSLCYAVDPVSSEPHFLQVSWGKMSMGGAGQRSFAGRATGFTLNYTLFDRDGAPLRATASLTLTADASLVLQNAQQTLQAPPVAVLTVPDMVPLPLLAVIGGALLKGGMDYLTLASSNDLDSLDAIEPGQTLAAPAE